MASRRKQLIPRKSEHVEEGTDDVMSDDIYISTYFITASGDNGSVDSTEHKAEHSSEPEQTMEGRAGEGTQVMEQNTEYNEEEKDVEMEGRSLISQIILMKNHLVCI